MQDVSVTRKGTVSSYAIPCTEFEMALREEGHSQSISVCIANESGLLYTVKLKMEGGGPEWELKSFTKEKSGVSRYLQCLEPVYCPYVKQPSGDEREACEREGGRIEEKRDERDCVLSYYCKQLGNATLEVEILANGKPVQGLEVDLWTEDQPRGPPTAGIAQTDSSGIARFTLVEGDYTIGFNNAVSPPEGFKYPSQVRVRVDAPLTKKSIPLERK
jgi:hypothetical protein